MNYDGFQTFTCEYCGTMHEVPYKDYPMRDRGKNQCLECGKVLHSWNGSRDYYDPKLSEKDPE